jgi:hypothetical protein
MAAAAAAAVVVMVLGCASVLRMSSRIDERATGRALRPVADGEPAAFERAALFDEAPDGDQIYVYWWRVIDPEARIPGVRSPPAVNTWLVSPALAELSSRDPYLAARYPNAKVIGEAGVAHPGELLAYRFVGPGVRLPERLAAHRGEDWIGDGSEVVDAYPVAVAGIALVGVPGLGLLAAALSPSTAALRRRLAILHAVGASPQTQRGVIVSQAMLAAGPGVVVGAVGWYVVAPRLRIVPFVSRPVFAGDLAVSPSETLAAAVGVVLLVALVALVRPRRLSTNRLGASIPPTPSMLRTLPLASGLAVMVAGVVVPGRAGAKLFLVGVLAATVGTVVALPYLLDRAGTRLAQHPSTVWLLIGRRLRSNAAASTRSLLAIGTLAALLPVVGAWVAVARTVDVPSSGEPTLVEVRGQLMPTEVAQIRSELPVATLNLVAHRNNDGTESLILVGDCSQLVGIIRLQRCDRTGFAFASDEYLGGVESLPGTSALPADAEVASTLFFSSEGRRVERELRAFVVNASHTGMQVLTPGRVVSHESPLVGWILGASTLAGIVGGAALVLHLAGQAARLAPTRLRLLALGCESRLIGRLAAAEAAISVTAVGLSCTAVGSVSSWMFVQLDGTASVPYLVIALVILGVLVAAALAGLAAGVAVSRHPERRVLLSGAG